MLIGGRLVFDMCINRYVHGTLSIVGQVMMHVLNLLSIFTAKILYDHDLTNSGTSPSPMLVR